MAKLAIVATIKAAPGGRDEYLEHLRGHGERCRTTEFGALQFDILVPQEEADTFMLYEVYASPETFQANWNSPSLARARQDAEHLQVSLKGIRCNPVE